MDVNVAKAVDSFMPAVLTTPNSAGSKAFAKLAEEFLQKLDAAKRSYQTEQDLENKMSYLASFE
jgi:MinD-like ATPase involved in chromosome partitioning or flagellar assembly